MDIDKLNLPQPKNPKLRSSDIATLDYYKFRVACKLIKKSIGQSLQTAVYTYLDRNWEKHEQRLIVEAKALGITPEELFMQLALEQMPEEIGDESEPQLEEPVATDPPKPGRGKRKKS